MREHRDQLALVWLALMSRCKNTSFKLWTRQTPGRGPVLSYWDQSLWNCCWISSWSKHIKMHSTKLALGSCLYFKVERNRENRRTSQADQAKAVSLSVLVPWLLPSHTQDRAQTWQEWLAIPTKLFPCACPHKKHQVSQQFLKHKERAQIRGFHQLDMKRASPADFTCAQPHCSVQHAFPPGVPYPQPARADPP